MGQCRAQAFSVTNAMSNLAQVAIVQRSCMEGKGWYLVEEARTSQVPVATKQDYRECNDQAERQTGTRDIFDTTYKEVYERCMRAWPR
jgi:hypothetical protein